jgi:hypothetical protein
MNTPLIKLCFIGSCLALLSAVAKSQNLPGSLTFTVEGSFVNGTAQGPNSILLADNDLTNGYDSNFDLKDAPASLKTSGPAGSAAFQWGDAADWTNYPHTSALWFEPVAVNAVAPGEFFDIGYLYYRNGTIASGTGASYVELALVMNFSDPIGMDPITATFGKNLINTVNSDDPISSADIVSLYENAMPINFVDDEGRGYSLELSFRVDQSTLDGTLSSPTEFRVFEGMQGRAELVGRFVSTEPIPEPSTALLAVIGSLVLFRRRRSA